MNYNTLFISDIHLGSKLTQSNKLINFLENNTFNKIYLVGDIINMNKLKKKFLWRRKHNNIIQHFLKLSKTIEIIYIYGKSDIILDEFVGQRFGNIIIKESDIHYTNNQEECLVIHGHKFENMLILYTKFYKLGIIAYKLILWVNKIINKFFRFLKIPSWSLSLYLKRRNKAAKNYIQKFEEMVAIYTKKEEMVDIVIAGYIHTPADKIVEGVRYLNCGCWTEFTSCVVEKINGDLKMLKI